ncbi:tRNA (adenosine(37)-N6)-threonylcarbamoyltransferase complex ATPase subunit type 1 TsaE [Candidatus Dependentiae bacterium]|nr:tRNA (adenosine(37)-N6)-threonylcarbamoyltransferase complex ATPase subunit type 1 TsaE [Candidatus Dependentiae bacterium]
MSILRYSYHDLDSIAEKIYRDMDRCKVFTFSGPLGAGKTTLIKQVLARCGVKEVVTSPTFTYVAVYLNESGQTFYHFDLYRMSSLSSFIDAGFDEYLYAPHSWAFIEWPEICDSLLTTQVCHLSLDYYSEDERTLTYTML